jgi:hypothetical protein
MPNLTQSNLSRKQFSRRKSFDIYKKVIELRKKEYSYSEIKKETGLAKSTINNWLSHAGLTLSKEHFDILSNKKVENHVLGMMAAKATTAKRKQLEIQAFIQSTKKYFSDPFFVAGVMLYQAEGSKGASNGFSNSDFRLVVVFVKFLEKYFLLDKGRNLTFRLYIHDSRKNDLLRILNFWSKKLSIDSKDIKLSWKHNIVTERRVNLNYVGQFEVRVRGFRNFTSKLLAVSDIILEKYKR